MKVDFNQETARYVYVLVREDILPHHQAIQAMHAAMLSASSYGLSGEERLVVLSVKNKDDLLKWSEVLRFEKIDYEMFFEPDHEYHFTAIATRPIPLTKIFKKLKLWNEDKNHQSKKNYSQKDLEMA